MTIQRLICSAAAVVGLLSWPAGTGAQQPQPQPGTEPLLSSVLGSDRRVGVEPGSPPEPRRFVFDRSIDLSRCLAFSLARPFATISPEGEPTGAGRPRFALPSSLAGAAPEEQVRLTQSAHVFLGTGLDHDGTTPLLAVLQSSLRRLDVFTVGGEALMVAEQTGVGRNRTTLDPGGDLMQGSVAGRRYSPFAGAIAHGLVVIQCAVLEPLGNEWGTTGVAFVESQDAGRTWRVVYEHTGAQAPWPRGRVWSLQNWWPLERGAPPREAYFLATDYRHNPGADGGVAYLFRASRAAVGAPWTAGPVVRLHESGGRPEEHFHAAGIVPSGAGLRAVVAIGDGQDNNRITSLTRDDHDYAAPGWAVDDGFHGSRGVMGLQGNQFVGCAPTADPLRLLVGADLFTEQVLLLTPGGPQSTHPRTQWVHGTGWSDGRRASILAIRTPTPEGGGPYTSVLSPYDEVGLGGWATQRLLYSPDGARWAHVVSPVSTTGADCVVHAGHLYFNRTGTTTAGLVRRAQPETFVTQRPLLIGSGGEQRARAAAEVEQRGLASLTPLSRSPEGAWMDGGVALEPQPPATGPVYRYRAAREDPGAQVVVVRPAGPPPGPGPRRVQSRLWILNRQAHKTASPTFGLGTNSRPAQLPPQHARVNCTDAWMPCTFAGEISFEPGETLDITIQSGQDGPDEQDCYIALDGTAFGAGFPGWPLPPDESSPPQGTRFPDERAAITGLVCGRAWTVTLAGRVPWDGWDLVCGEPLLPLATLWGDEANHIEVAADIARHRLLIRTFRHGRLSGSLQAAPIWWVRGDPVLISIAEPGYDRGLRVTVAAGGLQPLEAEPAAPTYWNSSTPVPPGEIRFGDPSGLSGDGGSVRVAPMEWFGGRIDERHALDAATQRTLLRSLSFLTDPIVGNPDADGDGERSIFDFLAFQNYFNERHAKGDFNRDGAWDIFDFLDFQTAFAQPCP